MLNEGNKRDEYLEKKGESSKTTAMRKSSERRGRFSSGETHQNAKRENITWTRPGTRGYDDSLNRQRKSAHRSGRGRTKPQAGTSSEQRKTDAIWQSRFPEDRPKGKYEKLQDKKREGQPTGIEAQKQGIIRKGERRRELRTQAVNAIRRAVGGGYVSEANFERGAKTFEEFIIEARRQSPKPTVLPRSRERDIGKHDDRNDKPLEWGDRPEVGKKLRRRLQAVVGTRRREDKETGVYEEFKDLTSEKEERVKNRMGELFRDVQVQDVRMKELRKKPFGKYRPEVKKEKEAILKSMKKKQKLVQNASDALITTSAGRSAKLLKRKEELKQKLRDLGVEP